MEISMHPIGIIHSPFTDKDQTPIQASRSQELSKPGHYSIRKTALPQALLQALIRKAR